MSSSRTVTCTRCGKRNRVPSTGHGKPTCGNCHAPLPWIADAADDDFAEVVDEATQPVLLDLWASWCAPCRAVSPILEQLAAELAGQIKLVKVDIDANPRTSERFDVQAVPTLALLNRGQIIVRQAGAAPAPVVRRWLEDAMSAHSRRQEVS